MTIGIVVALVVGNGVGISIAAGLALKRVCRPAPGSIRHCAERTRRYVVRVASLDDADRCTGISIEVAIWIDVIRLAIVPNSPPADRPCRKEPARVPTRFRMA